MSTALLESPPMLRHGSRPSRRLLLVAYAFPPVGGAGVQRPVKWVKYLQRAGWNVTVLTPENPSVPVLDRSLLAEVPDETAFVRPRTWEPGYQLKQQLGSESRAVATWSSLPKRLVRRCARASASVVLQPDPQILWYRNAVRTASAHLRSTPHNAILVTAPPYSSFLIGAALKQRFDLPLVLDYRDEWDLSSRYLENAPRDWISQFVQERMQQSVLRQADAVVATTEASVHRLQQRLNRLGRRVLTACIYNGYDAEDFNEDYPSSTVPAVVPGTFRIVYTGTLWNLTTIAPLVAGLEELQRRSPELASRVELVCVGRKTPEQLALLTRLKSTSCRLVNLDYCDHATAIDWLRSADALCLLLSDVIGAERVVPAKLFEYLAVRKDVLALMPPGEAADIVRRFHPHGWFSPEDIQGVTHWLQAHIQHPEAHGSHAVGEPDDIAQFSRERQTERLLDLLEAIIAGRPA